MPPTLGLGLDLGSSGARLALMGAFGDAPAELWWERAVPYPTRFEDPESWRHSLVSLVAAIPCADRERIEAIAIAGTSGTLLVCRPDGSLPGAELSKALPYHHACPGQQAAAAVLVNNRGPAASASGSLARALELMERAQAAGIDGPLWLRHQADWLMGWLLGTWRWGEEGNNLRLGWDLQRQRWSGAIASQSWAPGLPQICPSGRVLGPLGAEAAAQLHLSPRCQVVAGSTDANAAVLAADPLPGDGITVLGTSLVLKQFVPEPLQGPGISCHRVAGRWLVGGASNAGAGILRRFFNDAQIASLSRQIDPSQPTGLRLRPLLGTGERFPVDDPTLEAVLEPRPVGDARYLQALLEGLTAIELEGWKRLRELGAPAMERVISLGGGAQNPQWRQLRQQALEVPVLNRPQLSAARGMARLALESLRKGDPQPEIGIHDQGLRIVG
jgi:sugar (pentulose or hexulose) kinase